MKNLNTNNPTKDFKGGGNSYVPPEISQVHIRVENGFAASANLTDFGDPDKAGSDLEINNGYDL